MEGLNWVWLNLIGSECESAQILCFYSFCKPISDTVRMTQINMISSPFISQKMACFLFSDDCMKHGSVVLPQQHRHESLPYTKAFCTQCIHQLGQNKGSNMSESIGRTLNLWIWIWSEWSKTKMIRNWLIQKRGWWVLH